MTTVYTVVSWMAILGYWLLIAGVTLRILMKRRAVPSAMAWLLIIYILPLVGIIAYLSLGELHLGKRRAERARAMWPSTAKWLNDLKACKHIFADDNSQVASSLFKLCERRQGIAGLKGNQLQLLTDSDDVMQAVIRDIQLARHNIEMVFGKFNRVDNPLSHSEGGSGLGLFLARQLARAHGGDVMVESALEKGSTFSMTLPKKLTVNQTIVHLSRITKIEDE